MTLQTVFSELLSTTSKITHMHV